MKKFLCVFSFAAVMLSFFFVGKMTTKNALNNEVVLNNVEALTYGDMPGMWCAGYKMGNVVYVDGFSIGFKFATGWSKSYLDVNVDFDLIKCCKPSIESNSCNMADEHQDCSQHVNARKCL